MIKTRQSHPSIPLVGWQGDENQPFRLLRLDEVKGKKPKDGHDPAIPHRIGFHAMLFVAEGTFDHWIDFKSHRLKQNQLLYIAPNQVHRFVKRKAHHIVWALLFRPDIFPSGLQQMHGGQAPWSITSYLWPCITNLDSHESALILEQFAFIRRLESFCQEGYRDPANHFVRGVIGLAFNWASRKRGKPGDFTADSRFLEFVELVEEFFASRRDAKWYAERMDCSQRTLNRVCQQTTGESAKTLLSRRVVTEAKRLLTHSTDSVNAVAEILGFDATTNFVRYFRNEAGMTPQAFRDIHRVI